MSLANDLRRAAALGWRGRLDLLRAVGELAMARARLAITSPETLAAGEMSAGNTRPSASQSALIDRVAFAVPRMGARVPWRSSCLVQALAARRWLARHGISTQLVLGARKPVDGDIEAHAWLKAGKRIFVGGDPGDYREFQRP